MEQYQSVLCSGWRVKYLDLYWNLNKNSKRIILLFLPEG